MRISVLFMNHDFMRLDSTSFDSTEMIQSFCQRYVSSSLPAKIIARTQPATQNPPGRFDGRFGFFWRAYLQIAFRIQVWPRFGNGSKWPLKWYNFSPHETTFTAGSWWNKGDFQCSVSTLRLSRLFCGWNDDLKWLDLFDFSRFFLGIQGENLLQAHHTSASISCWKYRLLELWRCWWQMAVARNSWSHKTW